MTNSSTTDAHISDDSLTQITADIVCAYISTNNLSKSDLPALIEDVSRSLREINYDGNGLRGLAGHNQEPAIEVKQSVHDGHIVCLEDGMNFKSLKRHLRAHHNLSPEEYRAKWGLPASYPMVAPNYSVARSKIAKTLGLGRK